MHFVYIIQSALDSSFYIGESADPINRLEKHNGEHRGYTATKQPWKLVYVERFDSRTEAKKRERFLKAQRNTAFYNKLIESTPFKGRLP